VSFQIASAVVGGILFLIMLIFVLSHFPSDHSDNPPGVNFCGTDPNC
jgi:hypothetical protein